MITKQDLDAAIKECEGQRSPNANTALKLAAFYTIKRELYPEEGVPRTIDSGYSYAAPPQVEPISTIDFDSDTEFGEAVNGQDIIKVLSKLDETMTNLYVINPPLYRQIMRGLSEL